MYKSEKKKGQGYSPISEVSGVLLTDQGIAAEISPERGFAISGVLWALYA